MAILTKNDILDALLKNDIVFNPALDTFQLQPHAVDLRLGFTFHIPKSWRMTENGRVALNIDYLNDQNNNDYFETVTLKNGQFFELLPNEFVIATTHEYIELNRTDLMAVLYPRSSFNRRGLSVNLTGIIDAGYHGSLVIPIQNNTHNQVIKIYPGERVCQLVFETLTSPLSPKDTATHGERTPKYHHSTKKKIHYKPDKQEEIVYIKTGTIDTLKQTYKL